MENLDVETESEVLERGIETDPCVKTPLVTSTYVTPFRYTDWQNALKK